MSEFGRLKIRERHRIQASPAENHVQEWWEWQVVLGRKVLSRHDTEEQAKRWVQEQTAKANA